MCVCVSVSVRGGVCVCVCVCVLYNNAELDTTMKKRKNRRNYH